MKAADQQNHDLLGVGGSWEWQWLQDLLAALRAGQCLAGQQSTGASQNTAWRLKRFGLRAHNQKERSNFLAQILKMLMVGSAAEPAKLMPDNEAAHHELPVFVVKVLLVGS